MHFLRKERQQNVKQNSNNSAISQREHHSIKQNIHFRNFIYLKLLFPAEDFPPINPMLQTHSSRCPTTVGETYLEPDHQDCAVSD